ncbi:MAG: membrane dipeptidase [Paludibacteraceae bacterium]|nr:membrane dipeptidase [Paludibacteraceae bacterium]
MKIGLVLEGGGMRGLYTAGVLDVMMEHQFMPDVVCRLFYPRYKALLRAIEQRNDRYNARLQQIRRLEQEGKVFVLRPSENISVGRLEKDIARLQALHQLGVADATRLWNNLTHYLSRII